MLQVSDLKQVVHIVHIVHKLSCFFAPALFLFPKSFVFVDKLDNLKTDCPHCPQM
jgi:hypothetical protein